jgi:hypothetical protein
LARAAGDAAVQINYALPTPGVYGRCWSCEVREIWPQFCAHPPQGIRLDRRIWRSVSLARPLRAAWNAWIPVCSGAGGAPGPTKQTSTCLKLPLLPVLSTNPAPTQRPVWLRAQAPQKAAQTARLGRERGGATPHTRPRPQHARFRAPRTDQAAGLGSRGVSLFCAAFSKAYSSEGGWWMQGGGGSLFRGRRAHSQSTRHRKPLTLTEVRRAGENGNTGGSLKGRGNGGRGETGEPPWLQEPSGRLLMGPSTVGCLQGLGHRGGARVGQVRWGFCTGLPISTLVRAAVPAGCPS